MLNYVIIKGIIELRKDNKAIVNTGNETHKVLFKEGIEAKKGDSILIEGQWAREDNKKVVLAHNVISSDKGLNRSIMLGRLGENPNIRYSQSGKAVCEFNIATDTFKDGETKAEWTKVVCFEKQAENCAKYLKKGSIVLVSGYLKIEQWENDKQEKKESYKLIANTVKFINTSAKSKEKQEIF